MVVLEVFVRGSVVLEVVFEGRVVLREVLRSKEPFEGETEVLSIMIDELSKEIFSVGEEVFEGTVALVAFVRITSSGEEALGEELEEALSITGDEDEALETLLVWLIEGRDKRSEVEALPLEVLKESLVSKAEANPVGA